MRILVVGTSGSGKSTLAQRLSELVGGPHVELDAINCRPGWVSLSQTDPDAFCRDVERATAGPCWVCDGNYSLARDIVWPRATHAVWLDYERPMVMARVVRRSLWRDVLGRKLWAGNREDWRRWFQPSHPIRWAWDTWARNRARYAEALSPEAAPHLQVFRLRHPGEAEALMVRLSSGIS